MIDYILQTRLRICLDHQASLYFQVVYLCKKMAISNYSIDDQILNWRKIICTSNRMALRAIWEK